jgi:hypothetical protein
LTRAPSTAPSPKPPAAANRRTLTGRPRETVPETIRHDRRLRHPTGPCPAAANRHDSPCPPRPWTASTNSGRCPTTSPCTWTPATTRTKPAHSSTSADCTVGSPTRARRHRSRQAGGGHRADLCLAEPPSTASPAATNAGPPSSTPSSTSPTRSSPSAA